MRVKARTDTLLQGKAAVIADNPTGIGFAAAKLFIEEGAFVFITGRRQKELDEAAKAIGDNVIGVQGDVSKLADLDRLYETVNAEGQRMASLGLNLPALLAMPRRGRCIRALQSASLGERCGHQDSQKCSYRPLPRRQLPKGRCVPRATAGGSRVSSP